MAFALLDQASVHHIGIELRIQSPQRNFLRRREIFSGRGKI
jgi:hypothetical protein